MELKKNIKIGLGFAIATIGAGAWWAATTTANLNHLTDAVKPIPEIQQDIATIKAILTTNPLAKE